MLIQRVIWVYAFQETLKELDAASKSIGDWAIETSEPNSVGLMALSGQSDS